MQKYKLAIFDMAGTTVNEDNIVYKTIHKALAVHGYETTLEMVLQHGAGKEKYQAICDILAYLKKGIPIETEAKKIFETFNPMLDKAYADLEVKPFDGVEETFGILKGHGIKVVLNTGYNSEISGKLLDKLQWISGKQFDLLVTADDVENGRPYPDMIELAMKKTGISDAGQVVKVGDSTVDIEEGKNAGCGLSIGITTGAQTREQLQQASPDYIINSITELQDIIIE